jgi:hypothetical protein
MSHPGPAGGKIKRPLVRIAGETNEQDNCLRHFRKKVPLNLKQHDPSDVRTPSRLGNQMSPPDALDIASSKPHAPGAP